MSDWKVTQSEEVAHWLEATTTGIHNALKTYSHIPDTQNAQMLAERRHIYYRRFEEFKELTKEIEAIESGQKDPLSLSPVQTIWGKEIPHAYMLESGPWKVGYFIDRDKRHAISMFVAETPSNRQMRTLIRLMLDRVNSSKK